MPTFVEPPMLGSLADVAGLPVNGEVIPEPIVSVVLAFGTKQGVGHARRPEYDGTCSAECLRALEIQIAEARTVTDAVYAPLSVSPFSMK